MVTGSTPTGVLAIRDFISPVLATNLAVCGPNRFPVQVGSCIVRLVGLDMGYLGLRNGD